MTPVAVWPAAVFLLTLTPSRGWTRVFGVLRPVAALSLIAVSLPWLRDLAAGTTSSGLFLVPLLLLRAALGTGTAWPQQLATSIILGCASGLAALLLATGVAGSVDTLWKQASALVPDSQWHTMLQAPVRNVGAALALMAVFGLLLNTVRAGGVHPRPAAIVHGVVVAAGLALAPEGPAKISAFWAVVAVHALAVGTVPFLSSAVPAFETGWGACLMARFGVVVVTFSVLEIFS